MKRFPNIPNYIKRSLETVLKITLSEFPAAVLTDPRQSGKTTLLKAIFGRKFDYVSLPHCGIDPQIYFWRTYTESEVDFVIEASGRPVPFEVSFQPHYARPWPPP